MAAQEPPALADLADDQEDRLRYLGLDLRCLATEAQADVDQLEDQVLAGAGQREGALGRRARLAQISERSIIWRVSALSIVLNSLLIRAAHIQRHDLLRE